MRVVGWLVKFTLILGSLALVVIAFGALCLINTQTALAVHHPPHDAFQVAADWILGRYGIKVGALAPADRLNILNAVANAWLAIVAVGLSFGPPIAAATLLTAWRQHHSLQVRQIHQEGKDDLELMYKYISRAEHLVIYSGDFSWLNPLSRENKPKKDGVKLRARLKDLCAEGKLRLISAKDSATLGTHMGADAWALYEGCLTTDSSWDLRCSIVRVSRDSYVVLTRHRRAVGDELITTVSVLTDAAETRGMLNTFSTILMD